MRSPARSWPSVSQVETQYQLEKADMIVSLDADFLSAGFPGFTQYARDFASRRNPDSENMRRFYAIESTPMSNGVKADHRLPVRAVEMSSPVALALARLRAVVRLPSEQQSLLRRLSKTCRHIAALALLSPASISLPRSTLSRTRSMRSWAMSARRLSTPIPSSRIRSISWNHLRICSPT